MKIFRDTILATVVVLSGLSAQAESNANKNITLVGVDESGKEFTLPVPKSVYNERFVAGTSEVANSTVTVLNRHNRTPWKMRTFVVGMGVSFEIGIGPIVKMSFVPRARLIFSNQKDVLLP